MSSLASIPAILHTRMDLSNERSATTTHRIEALQRILPSLASFLDRDAAASIQDLGGRYCESESQRCDFSQENVDHEAATREFCKEGPLPYLDLQIDLRFETQVEVWIDTLSGLTSSTVPRQSRYLFLFEPEEITLLRESVKQNVHHFCRIFTHDWNTIVALPASSAVLFPHGGTWILPSAMRVYASQNVGVGSCDLLDHEVVDNSSGAQFARRKKRFGVSFVCGRKKLTHGHRLRQELWKEQQSYPLDILQENEASCPRLIFFSSGISMPDCRCVDTEEEEHGINRPLIANNSVDGTSNPVLPAQPPAKLLLFDWMFHIAIENVSRDDYFTEKLLDCFLTRTVPIYWGCPNISNYFDAEGIIHINTLNNNGALASEGSNTYNGGGIYKNTNLPSIDGSAEEDDDCMSKDVKEICLRDIATRVLAVAARLQPADYECRREAIGRNFKLAQNFIDQRVRMERAIDETRLS